mgnify:CR=1 FL=1
MINGAFMFLSALLSYIYKDGITGDLILSGTIVSIIGLLMLFLNKNHDKQISFIHSQINHAILSTFI